MQTRVLIVAGGNTNERTPSLENGLYVKKLLDYLPEFHVSLVDFKLDDHPDDVIAIHRPDVVFNACVGGEGENGSIPEFLDRKGIPYTHSRPMASILAWDKGTSKLIADSHNIPILKTYIVCKRRDVMRNLDKIEFPCVVKPIQNGSSLGVLKCHTPDDLTEDAVMPLYQPPKWSPNEVVIVEEMADSNRDFTVGIVCNRIMAASECVVENHPFYNTEAKLDWWAAVMKSPADIAPEHREAMRDAAIRIHDGLGCRGATRTDFMLHKGKPYFIEINTHPVLNDPALRRNAEGVEVLSETDLVRAILLEAISEGPR